MDISRHEELLSKRRLTVLSGSEEHLASDEMDNEEIIEGSICNFISLHFMIESEFLIHSNDGLRTALSSRDRR